MIQWQTIYIDIFIILTLIWRKSLKSFYGGQGLDYLTQSIVYSTAADNPTMQRARVSQTLKKMSWFLHYFTEIGIELRHISNNYNHSQRLYAQEKQGTKLIKNIPAKCRYIYSRM